MMTKIASFLLNLVREITPSKLKRFVYVVSSIGFILGIKTFTSEHREYINSILETNAPSYLFESVSLVQEYIWSETIGQIDTTNHTAVQLQRLAYYLSTLCPKYLLYGNEDLRMFDLIRTLKLIRP